MFSNLRFGRQGHLYDTAAAVPIVVYKGQLLGGGTSTTNPTVASGSVAVVAGDLIWAVNCGQSGAITCTGAGDNLGHTYTAQNAGTVQGGVTAGRAFYKIVTTPGTLTAVNFVDTASANDCAVTAAVFGGPFSAIDANPVNRTDNTTGYTSTASGTLAQPLELIVIWLAAVSAGDPFTADAAGGWLDAGTVAGTAGLRRAHIAYKDVTTTAADTGGFDGAATGGNAVIGLASFMRV